MFPKIEVPPNHPVVQFNKVFHDKPSILGYPYFWNPPNVTKTMPNFFGRPCFLWVPLNTKIFFNILASDAIFFHQNPWKSPNGFRVEINLHVAYWLNVTVLGILTFHGEYSQATRLLLTALSEQKHKFNHTHKHTPFVLVPHLFLLCQHQVLLERNMQEKHTNHKLVVEPTHLKNMSQIGSLALGFRMETKNL